MSDDERQPRGPLWETWLTVRCPDGVTIVSVPIAMILLSTRHDALGLRDPEADYKITLERRT